MYAGGCPALGVFNPAELEARRVDEPVALGDEVGLPVVVGGVAVEEDAALLVDHVGDAPHERDER